MKIGEKVGEYLKKLPADFNLPNIMMTTYFVYYKNRVTFREISFKPREKGTNSINLSCNTAWSVSRYEQEADRFAVCLLLRAAEDLAAYETLTVREISRLTHIPESKAEQLFF